MYIATLLTHNRNPDGLWLMSIEEGNFEDKRWNKISVKKELSSNEWNEIINDNNRLYQLERELMAEYNQSGGYYE